MTAQGLAMAVYRPAQNTVVDSDKRRYTNMNETRNETNRFARRLWREAGPNDLTFRLRRGGSR